MYGNIGRWFDSAKLVQISVSSYLVFGKRDECETEMAPMSFILLTIFTARKQYTPHGHSCVLLTYYIVIMVVEPSHMLNLKYVKHKPMRTLCICQERGRGWAARITTSKRSFRLFSTTFNDGACYMCVLHVWCKSIMLFNHKYNRTHTPFIYFERVQVKPSRGLLDASKNKTLRLNEYI